MARKVGRGRIVLNSVDATPKDVARFESCEKFGAKPPQRSACGMFFDDAATCQQQARRVGTEMTKGRGGFNDQFGGIGVP